MKINSKVKPIKQGCIKVKNGNKLVSMGCGKKLSMEEGSEMPEDSFADLDSKPTEKTKPDLMTYYTNMLKPKEQEVIEADTWSPENYLPSDEYGRTIQPTLYKPTYETKKWAKGGDWMSTAVKKPGAFTEYCKDQGYKGVTQDCIDKAKNSSNKTTSKRAVLAETFRKMKHEDGGQLELIVNKLKAREGALFHVGTLSMITHGNSDHRTKHKDYLLDTNDSVPVSEKQYKGMRHTNIPDKFFNSDLDYLDYPNKNRANLIEEHISAARKKLNSNTDNKNEQKFNKEFK